MDPFVSREWTARPTYNHDIGWDRRPRPTRRRHRNDDPRQSHKGPSPLTEMAARVVAANVHNFDPLYLKDLPPKVLQAILKQLAMHPDSLSLTHWKTAWMVIRALKDPRKPTSLALRFHQHFEQTVAPLSVYLKPLQTDKFTFISHLKIAGTCLVDSTELMHLPILVKNLGILEIVEPSDDALPFPRLSDRLVKAWSLHEDPFPRLKVLRVHTNGSLTHDCLQYITRFPALALFQVLGARMAKYSAERLAEEYGWIYAKLSAAPTRSIAAGDTYFQEDTDLHTRRPWLHLARIICSKFMLNCADAGAQGYEIYTQLGQPVLNALQSDLTLCDTHLSSGPFVSLTLGRGRQASGADPSPNTLFFWRYWDHSGPDGLEPQFSPAKNAIIRPTPSGPVTKAKPREEEETGRSKRKASEPGGQTLRPRKKLRFGSVGEALSLLQGK